MRINLPNLKQALVGQLDKNNVIANNLANINTVGFKKDRVFFDTLDKEMKNRNGVRQTVDFSQGHLKETANPLDIALSGPGFFTVETEDGEAYTRQGHLKIDAEGILRTADGRAVVGESGPIVIIGKTLKPQKITFTQNGEVYADDEYIDRLRIVRFENPADVEKMGGNLFRAKNDAEPIELEEPELHQGFLEESNVNPAEEMIQLIDVQRQFESIQRMVRALDDTFSKAANQVGRY